MAQLKKQHTRSITHFFIYSMAFLILWEWLRPIPQVTNTAEIHVFVLFALLSAVLIYFRISYWIIVPVLLIASLYGVHTIFYEGSFFSLEGVLETLRLFTGEVKYNLGLIYAREFAYLTDPFRTFLLLLLLALICYLLYFWIFHTKRIFFFLFTTIIYITVLDTFTPVDASVAIVRIVVIGFFMITLLQMLKVQDEERVISGKADTFLSPTWMYTLIVMITIAIIVGIVAPKPDPQWSDPVPTIRSVVLGEDSRSGSTTKKIGYGENDEKLGGGFAQDDELVFQAEVVEPVYWRGESKNHYTGQGWVSGQFYEETNTIFEEEVEISFFEELVEVEDTIASVKMEEDVGFSHFFYPGQFKMANINTLTHQVAGEEGAVGNLTFSSDAISGRIQAHGSTQNNVTLTSYDIVYEQPTFPIETLRNISEADPEEIQMRYLQLPEELPERVTELAKEIVEGQDTRYDQVVAVEQYFSENDFIYQTTDVPVPEEGQDYVDQFLFETQLGYCDNYSTSMAVLLRTLDIPTRWVKGFTAGEWVEEIDENRYLYEVRNGNAHSWVEVYFPGVGWVPFEPTQGFDNYTEFEEEETVVDVDTAENETAEPASDPLDREDPFAPEDEEASGNLDEETASGSNKGDYLLYEWLTLKNIIISIVVAVLVVVFYQKQHYLQNKYFLVYYRVLGKDEKFVSAYQRLLWILKNEGLERAEGETLREYAKRIDKQLNSNSMGKLTKTYERVYYGDRETKGEWQTLQKEWEAIVKKMGA
ncbi:peptidase [Salipaludibacillus neizhouensis]|uniref:Peptidase n=1 Tax=Salipaludibacillus neizhouensis TaxID=885475 RepID=A0A3A9K9Q1_9BACI|nr:transglutaminaseTgpA domain-containing protein [Salipaludibacillus neizhouensis]RKL67151.1 peptidase [Salipaludibacillus neizhouensis]